MIHFLSESDVKAVVQQQDVTNAVERCFIGLSRQSAWNYPVVRRPLDYQNAIFGFKAAFDGDGPGLGVKAGGLWPGNRDRGVPNHQSTIMLFDPDSGAPTALVCGTYLNSLRTAAASALSIRHLARINSRVLGITGTGGQAEYQIRACFSERSFDRVLLPQRESGSGQRLSGRLQDLPVSIEVLPMEALCRESDVLVTVALSFEAYVQKDWISKGTHLACMGTDSLGKCEVDPSLLRACAIFGDSPDQNALLGECQHAVSLGWLSEDRIVSLGDVITGLHPGRASDEQITLFDSTGMGLQDLAAARVALTRAQSAGRNLVLDQWGEEKSMRGATASGERSRG